jgi:SAM-dependent methyltransferase
MKGFIENIENTKEYIEQNLILRKEEKDKYGEVLTPTSLIDEILDQFPSEIWKNKDLTWLDPCAGTGNYFAIVYSRYMKSLSTVFPDKQQRSNHILQNMLFMVELNPSNVRTLRELFGEKSNISKADFLDKKSIEEYDIVIGNPPFQVEKKGVYEGSSGHLTLWDKFVKQALSALKPNGYLAFITPANWRRPESDLYEIMTKQNQLLFLHIYGKSAAKDLFGIQSRFDNYLIKKSAASPNVLTKIIDELGDEFQEDVSCWPFLPNYEYKTIRSFLTKSNGIAVIFDSSFYDARKLKTKESAKYKYPVVHTITKTGLGIKYADRVNPDQIGIKKVILNFNEKQYPYNDFQGKYGMSQLSFGIPISSKKEGEQWIKFISSDMFVRVLKATKWNAFQTDYRMFRYFDRNRVSRKTTLRKNNKTRKMRIK